MRQENLSFIEDQQSASVVLDPLRLRILQELTHPDSASGVARKLGMARQKVNYHLRELEKYGFVEQVEERKRGNCVERIVQSTARSYLINPEAMGSLAADPDQIQDRVSSAYLVAVAARAIRELSLLQRKSENAGKKLPTFTLHADVSFASTEDRNAFTQELSNSVAHLIAKYHKQSSGSRRFRFLAGAYPAITKKL